MNNPDTFVTWLRTDEPGQDPRWESQCGVVVQTGFGTPPTYWAFVAPLQTGNTVTNTTTLASAKKFVETEFQKTNELKWSYSD